MKKSYYSTGTRPSPSPPSPPPPKPVPAEVSPIKRLIKILRTTADNVKMIERLF
jgi:hypothetical protein